MSGPATPLIWDLDSDLPVVVANWEAIENAIHAQIAAGSGLAVTKVVWMHQTADRPDTDFIGLEHLGSEYEAPATPEIGQRDNPDSITDDGEELILSALDTVNFGIRLHFYTKTATGAGSARARLAAVRGFLGCEKVTEELDESDIVLVECGPVQALPAILETRFESRATLDVRFKTVDGFEEKVTYIETINAGITIPNSDGTPSVPPSIPVVIVQP